MKPSKLSRMRLLGNQMSNMPGCDGKQQFDTLREAELAVRQFHARFPHDEKEAYLCRHCNKFHFGKKTFNKGELETEKNGRFLAHEGLTYACIKDPVKINTFWIFVVPPDTSPDEADVMKKGALVAHKFHQDIWREKNREKSKLHQLFFSIPSMNYAGTLVDFAKMMESHTDHMQDLKQLKMNLLNGQVIPSLFNEVEPVEKLEAKLIQEQEMYRGRAVFRSGGRPYHRDFYQCHCSPDCREKIEVRAYIRTGRGTGELTTVQSWMPVDSRATQKPGRSRRDREWISGECMAKITGEAKAPSSFVASPGEEPAQDVCSYCGEKGHWRPDCPKVAAAVRTARAKASGWQTPATILKNLQSIAQDASLTAEFKVGATLLACQLVNPQSSQFQL